MPTSTKDGRRLTGYRGETDNNSQHNSLYDDDMEDYQHYGDDDVYEEYDEDEDQVIVDNDQDDDTGSELSIPDPNIDFDLVYALHTFAATVEGQASVVRGDALTLLDDSNSYWWLVKVLKTSAVGYIPAENIETPHERLARLNSHRNIELTRRDIQDAFPIPPSNTKKPKKTNRVTLAKGVQFQSQVIYGGSSDDEDEAFEAEFAEWDERMRSDDSDSTSSEDSEDPYTYYEDTSSQRMEPPVMDPVDYYNEDSDILNEDELHETKRDTMNLEEETIKISLTPSIARDDTHRGSDSSIQTKLKKAAKLEQLLGSSGSPEPMQQQRRGSKDSNTSKKEKSGIRKFFSRSSSKGSKGDRRSSTSSQYETASIDSQSTLSLLDTRASVDSQQATKLQIHAGSGSFINANGTVESYKFVSVYPNTTATELIYMTLQDQHQLQEEDMTYQDYYLIVRTIGGDELTLVPSDRPLEIYHSLNTHLSTPMPSLKKARRISQLMGSDNHIGGPVKEDSVSQVQFYLLCKTKSMEEGEIQVKVSLFPSQHHPDAKRVDKLVKLPSSILVKDTVTLLLEKFHILNGVVASHQTPSDDTIKSLRLDSDGDIVKYHLALNQHGQESDVTAFILEHLLDLEEKLLNVFGEENIPPIHYKRHSNPDRSSITVNITPPEKDEVFFILKCVETFKKPNTTTEQEQHGRRRLARQDTPMPRHETTPTDGFHQVQVPILTNREITASPEIPVLSNSPDTSEDLISQLDEAIDTLNNKPTTVTAKIRPQSAESVLISHHDFGMNDLMVMIRGAAAVSKSQQQQQQKSSSIQIRSEISDVFKDSQTRLDQLEKELDRLMTEAVKVYH